MSSPLTDIATIDLRHRSLFRDGHLAGAAHFNWPALKQQLYLLPDRHVPLQLVGPAQLQSDVSAFLESKGYQVKRWIEETELTKLKSALISGSQHARLWQPCATVVEAARAMSLKGKRVLDLGCGAGRDAVYLAAQGAEVTAIDYIKDMEARVAALAETEQVSVNFICEDLEREKNILNARSRKEWNHYFDMIVAVRYLNRALFPVIPMLLAKGGILVWHTFMQGCEKIGSPKNPRFLLAENELARQFDGMTILKNEVQYLPDGRPVNAFIGQQ